MKKLLVNGKETFDEIYRQIHKTSESIEIRMFIWRDDIIGNQLLEVLYKKAKEGIKITIYKDAYGLLFEKSEENQLSLFHKAKTRKLDFIASLLTKFYHPYSNKLIKQVENDMFNKFVKLPNVIIESKVFKDHSKYFIFDDKTLIVSGINVEDKEVYGDLQKRMYQDYALLIDEKDEVEYFKSRYQETKKFDKNRNTDYLIRNQANQDQNHLIALMNQTKESIIMHMAYFGNRKVNQTLFDAVKRGVRIDIITSEISNIQTNFNMKQINLFTKKGMNVYLNPGLIHAKAILFDKRELVIGSWNLNNAAVKKLFELSIMVKHKETISSFIIKHDDLLKRSIKVNRKLRYRKVKALFESIYS